MIEIDRLSWKTFTLTGNIDAYLAYKNINEFDAEEGKEDTWHKSEQEVLS